MPYLRVCWEVQWSVAITNDKVYADVTIFDCKQIPRPALSPRISIYVYTGPLSIVCVHAKSRFRARESESRVEQSPHKLGSITRLSELKQNETK